MEREQGVPLNCKVTVRILKETRAFGPGVAQLLRGIGETGSLQGAAQQMGMSYSKAWTVMKEAENIWGFPLTERHVGGLHGGHSVLTAQAQILLQRYDSLEDSVCRVAQEKFAEYFNPQELRRLKEIGHGK